MSIEDLNAAKITKKMSIEDFEIIETLAEGSFGTIKLAK